MKIWDPEGYIKAWNFAAQAHLGQTLPGSDIPYINHLGNVAMEIMQAICLGGIEHPNLAVQAALLHDTLEDTKTEFSELQQLFGEEVATGVLALSKNLSLADKRSQMLDSLQRIQQQPVEIAMVKLADRITNLQPPPKHWQQEKIQNYQSEARIIHQQLGLANSHLAHRLLDKIESYGVFSS